MQKQATKQHNRKQHNSKQKENNKKRCIQVTWDARIISGSAEPVGIEKEK